MILKADKVGKMIQLPDKENNKTKFYVAYPESVNVKSVHIYDLCTISQFLHQCYIFLASAHLSGSNSKSLLFWCVISLLKISVIYSNGSIPIILHV